MIRTNVRVFARRMIRRVCYAPPKKPASSKFAHSIGALIRRNEVYAGGQGEQENKPPAGVP